VTQTEPPVIEIRDLHKSFGDLEVLKGVDMTAQRGDVVSLIGSSGSGKSTLLRCANLLEDSQQGDIIFEGEPVKWRGTGRHRHPADKQQMIRIRTNLAMVFQQFNLWAHMSILQNVMEAPVTVLKISPKEAESRARALLAKVGIGDKCEAFPASCPAVSNSARQSRAPWRWSQRRCCSTSRPRRSTPSWSAKSSRLSRTWPKRAAPCCW